MDHLSRAFRGSRPDSTTGERWGEVSDHAGGEGEGAAEVRVVGLTRVGHSTAASACAALPL